MRAIYKRILLTFCCSLLLLAARAQGPMENIVNAVRQNKIADVAKYFDNIVPITINNVQTAYSRSQAELVLKDFFTKNFPQDVTVISSGSPNSTSKFVISDLVTDNGVKYTLYILVKLKDNTDYYLQEIRINKK